MRIFPSVFLAFAMYAFADTATQTDWSGGSGNLGPVIDLGSDFLLDTGVDWSFYEGSLLLGPEENKVNAGSAGAHSLFAADIDDDGDIDLLGASYSTSEIIWWENVDGFGDSWSEHLIDGDFNGAYSLFAADIDGDGDKDVLAGAFWDGEITWWENIDGSGDSWSEHLIDEDFKTVTFVFAADIDGDGDNDVLGASYTADDVTWWENVDGSGSIWSGRLIDGDYNGASSLFAADIDSDGDMDVLGAANSADEVTWWENVNGSGSGDTWSEHLIDGDFDGAESLFAADIDSDGDIDVLGTASVGDKIVWWENVDGLGNNWSEYLIDGDFDGAKSAFSVDIDGDGDIDVLGSEHAGSGKISWWENVDGSGYSWSEHMIDEAVYATSVFAIDIDGDGDVDLLGGNYADVTWWDLNSYESNGALESSLLEIQDGSALCWSEISWNSDCPAGTELGFQVRATDTGWESPMPEWSDTLWNPCSLEGILPDDYHFVQYRVVMDTSDPSLTPVLYDITLSWNENGVEDQEVPFIRSIEFLPFSPNPVNGRPVARFSLVEPNDVELTVFSISGRVVDRANASGYPAGYGNIILRELPPGLYICRMTSGGVSGTRRFIVTE